MPRNKMVDLTKIEDDDHIPNLRHAGQPKPPGGTQPPRKREPAQDLTRIEPDDATARPRMGRNAGEIGIPWPKQK